RDIPLAIVVGRISDATFLEPMFIRQKAPVPYVFVAVPGSSAGWPKSAACWSPPIPETGTDLPNKLVSAKTPEDACTAGKMPRGTSRADSNSSSQRRSKMLYSSVREAFV